jgi:hypothetical protein
MLETGHQYSIDHRQEILTPIFDYIKGGESFYVVGGASMGKTRLLDFVMREEVQKHYLGEKADQFWLIRVDMNRLSIRDEAWAFYELLLSSIVLEVGNHDQVNGLRTELVDLNARVIQSHDLLLALRFFEMAVNRLCQVFNLKLCFLLDEFDEAYKNLSRETFSQLRAVRDANKSRVSYGVFLRNLPERLRPSPDNESFYELLSRNMLGLKPYSREDSLEIIQQLESRRNISLTPVQRERLYEASGGHVGLILAFLSIMIETPQASQKDGMPGWIEWFGGQPVSIEECRKIWEGLSPDERTGLSTLVRGNHSQIPVSTLKLLWAKGLLRTVNDAPSFFSPVFELYVRSLS